MSSPSGGGGAPDAGGAATSGGGAAVTDLGGDSFMTEAGESTGGAAGGTSNTGGLGGVPANGGAGGGVATGGSGGNVAGSAGNVAGSGGSAGAPHELAVGKKVTASDEQTGNEASKGNDNDATTRWCATDGSFPQWWRVDLGATHPLVQVSIRFEYPDRRYFYLVETSPDDTVYTQQITANGTGVTQTIALPANVSARYVRVTVTSATPLYANGTNTWVSFWEFSLTGY